MLISMLELTLSAVGVYNFVKGVYNMYCDAEEIKNQYREHQKTMYEYKLAQNVMETSLTESQFHRFEGEFVVLNKTAIIDPYKNGHPKLSHTN